MVLIARLPLIRRVQRDRRRGILGAVRKCLITGGHLPQRRRHTLVLALRRLQLALHRRKMLIHRGHDQLRTRRRLGQRCGRRRHRARLVTNQPRCDPALLANRAAPGGGLLQLLIQTRSTGLRLLIGTSGPRNTAPQPTATIRCRRHRTATRRRQVPAITASRKQVMRTGQQPINPSHKPRNTHPPKLTRPHPARPHPSRAESHALRT